VSEVFGFHVRRLEKNCSVSGLRWRRCRRSCGANDATDPDCTHVFPVGNVTNASFPHFPKDNFFFGVRAVDQTGPP